RDVFTSLRSIQSNQQAESRMSLEQAVAELTTAIKTNNELLTRVLENAPGVSSEAPAAPAKSRKAAEKKAEPKKAEPKKDDAVPSLEDVRKVFGDYLSVDDADERRERADNVKAILNELGVEKATLIEEGDRAKAIEWVHMLQNG